MKKKQGRSLDRSVLGWERGEGSIEVKQEGRRLKTEDTKHNVEQKDKIEETQEDKYEKRILEIREINDIRSKEDVKAKQLTE